MDYKKLAQDKVGQMSLEEKVKFITGKDFWTIEGLNRLSIPEAIVTDGPHGLRKQVGDYDRVGLTQSYPSTCFPAACTSSCSFNEELLYQMGVALAEECLKEDVSVLLGPGINHKRSPLCGRNFEYFSEDPVVTGTLATSYVKGVQSKKIGTSLKHFAANSQEKCRLTNDSIIDERALNEIYLRAFEMVVKKAQPYSIMPAYNLLNGEYCCQNKTLLTDICREKWGFEGFFVSDWGAMSDPLSSYRAGLDLEMPGLSKGSDKIIMQAIKDHKMEEKQLDEIVTRIVMHLLRYADSKKQEYSCDMEEHAQLAKTIAEESIVLLKNDNQILPLKEDKKILIVGDFAKHPRYQGAGSSLIQPYSLDNVYELFENSKYNFEFAQGYLKEETKANDEFINDAMAKSENADVILIFSGLPESYESEGFDRVDIQMPESHLKLIDTLTKSGKPVVVILQAGGVVAMPFVSDVAGLLLANLGGSKNGEAIYNVLTGVVNPSGRLSETFPLRLEDTPCFSYYLKDNDRSLYKESIFTGYRYYDTADVPVLFPFGYGLSYTNFSYTNMCIDKKSIHEDDPLTIQVTLKNFGPMIGKEVIQIYVGMKDSKIYRAKKELKAFKKISLKPQEEKSIVFTLNKDAFSFYNVNTHKFCVESGIYQIYVCKNVQEVLFMEELVMEGKEQDSIVDEKDRLPSYYDARKITNVSDEEYEVLLKKSLPKKRSIRPYTIDTRIGDIKKTSFLGNMVISHMAKKIISSMPITTEGENTQRMLDASLYDMPLRSAGMGAPLTKTNIDGYVDIFNLHLIRGFKKMKEKNKR